jgi:uncharacterized protein YdbL (DUF1318 family)
MINSKEGFAMKKLYVLGLALSLVILTTASFCFAADYDYKTMTPDIEKALKNRQSRYHQLQSLKQEGEIGEDNKGYVTNLKENTEAATLTQAENQDRRVLYEALAEQNKLGSTGLLEIQKAFAEVQKEKAGPGDMIQSPSGDWKRKAS